MWNQKSQRLVNFPVMVKRLADGVTFGARTDENGHYRVDVPFGTYKVLAQGGNNYAEDPWYVSLWWDGDRTEQDAREILVNQDMGGWWAGFNLPRGGAISGKVTKSDGTTAIADAWVKASDYGNWEALGATKTDAQGNYRLVLEPRGVRVIAGADGYVPEYYKEAADPNQAGKVDVTEGEETSDINFTLAPGGSISGTVYKADGTTPLPKADVTAVLASDPMVSFSTRADDQGKYKVNAPFGGYKVMAKGSKDPSSDPKFAAQWYNKVTSWEQATTLDISPEVLSKTGIDFSLVLGGAISGTVTDEWDNPDWSATIIVRDAATGMLVGSAKMEWLSAEGKPGYVLYGLASGQYQVTASANQRSRVFYNNKEDWETADPVTVTAPDTKKDINFKLAWADGRISGDVSYSGQVTDPENHQVIILAQDTRMTDYQTEEAPAGYSFSITGPGHYTINNVGKGPYLVIAFLDVDDNELVGRQDPDDPYGFYGEPTPVVITRDATTGQWSYKVGIDVEITDTPKGIVSGKVEMELRATYDGATITVGTQTTTSTADGSYFMLIAPGTYDVKISMPGYLPARMSGVEVGELISGAGRTTLPPAWLIIGDANNDEAINSGDLLLVASAFGTSPPSKANADINKDNAVNIYDIAWVAKNFGKTESLWVE